MTRAFLIAGGGAEASGLARDVESAQIPRVELRGEENVIDKALDLSVGF